MNPPLQVVILAAGKGTRMNSALPKVLHELAGQPLLGHVLAAAEALGASRTVVVYGHGGEAVPGAFARQNALFVLQEPQLGTGHALRLALPALEPRGVTLVLYGDVPLTRPETLRGVLAGAGAGLSMLTAELDDPTGYGRVVRDPAGRVLRIVEQRDADAAVAALREVNTGILAAPAQRLAGWLERLTPDNSQGEYYLTDVIAMAVADGLLVATEQPQDAMEADCWVESLADFTPERLRLLLSPAVKGIG